MTNFKNYKDSEEYKGARLSERESFKHFYELGYECELISDKKRQVKDIDLIIVKDGVETKVSVKHQDACAKTKNIFLEFKLNGKPSWYITGEADLYDIKVLNLHYVFDKKILKKAVKSLIQKGCVRVAGLTAKQNKKNHQPQKLKGYCVPLRMLMPFCKEVYK